jgi:hypothetical protein
MMGKGLEPSGISLVLCIILILVGIWMTYFDNHPHGHYGTIRQQIWSSLHFFLHLAIVGVVEGAQQVALARYVLESSDNFANKVTSICLGKHLDGDALFTALDYATSYYTLDEKAETLAWASMISDTLKQIKATPGICSNAKGSTFDDLPERLNYLHHLVAGGIYTALGIKFPADKYPEAVRIAHDSWRMVYRYFWTANAIMFTVFIIFTLLIRLNKFDFFDFAALLSRCFALVAVAVCLGVSGNRERVYHILDTPWVLPTAIALLYLIILLDRFGRWYANKRNNKSGQPLIHTEHGHGHGDDHGNHAPVDDKTGAVTTSEPYVSAGNQHGAPQQ